MRIDVDVLEVYYSILFRIIFVDWFITMFRPGSMTYLIIYSISIAQHRHSNNN